MGYANYIGRVGGLAVALGVGMAVASTTGVAWADTTDAGSPSADSSSAPTRGSAKAARAAQASTPNARFPLRQGRSLRQHRGAHAWRFGSPGPGEAAEQVRVRWFDSDRSRFHPRCSRRRPGVHLGRSR